MPAAWSEPTGAAIATPLNRAWWRSYGSAQLEPLLDEALAGSGDLRIAAQRVRQADIALQLAGASLLPGMSASVGSSTSRSEGSGTLRKSTSASVNVSYEVDMWGRIAAGAQGAEASLAASRYDFETARITLVASVAITYFQLLATRERVTIALQNLATAERVLRIVEARARFGVATPLELAQQTTTVLQQRTAVLPLEVQARQTASALALLLGRTPQGFRAGEGESLLQLTTPPVTPGLPSSLLQRRPDLAAAEARLAAADADVAAARAALLPSISLSAGGGTGSAQLFSLTTGGGSISLGLSLAQTLFDGGRKQLQIESSRAQRQALVDGYGNAVRSALKEVEDALSNSDRNTRQERTQQEVVAQAQRTLGLAELRYREGVETLTTVLDAQRTLFSAQDTLAQFRLARLTSSVDLYRVLAGGWEPAT